MDKQTLSNYGWIIIVVLVLAVMLALATPFGTYVGDGVVSVANGFVGTSDNAIDQDNIDGLSNKWNDKLNPKSPEELIASGIVPEGGIYTAKDGTVYNAGDTMPTVASDDIFTYGDYKYIYYQNDDDFDDGWNVSVLDKTKTEYGVILESINGQPVNNLVGTFCGCESLTDASNIVIPSSITNMQHTFGECYNLTVAPAIPNSVTNMMYTFYWCTSLTGNIEINANPTNYLYCLYNTAITSISGDCTIKDEILATVNE